MNFKHHLPKLFLASLFAIFLAACGGEPKDTAETTAAPAVDSTAAAPATLFAAMTVKHTVADFAKWKPVFDAHAQARTDAGLTIISVLQDKTNPNIVLVSTKASDLQKARDFSSSPVLKEAMQKSGVTSAPEVAFYNVLRFDEAAATSKDRLLITHRVKDFDAWLKVFDGEGGATRASNGVVDRALGRGVDDPNMVLLAFVVTDMAKAQARVASEDLKKVMMDAGVEGPPQINFYTVAQ
ncbi:MAG: hypothetical protein IPM82_10065 [Saprospiraceae bacterium]|nr:hypothetical protein [Saprospiraceae bacterium]